MAATPEDLVPHTLDKDNDVRSVAPARKPWQAPRLIVSEVGDTQYASQHSTNDSPLSQIS